MMRVASVQFHKMISDDVQDVVPQLAHWFRVKLARASATIEAERLIRHGVTLGAVQFVCRWKYVRAVFIILNRFS